MLGLNFLKYYLLFLVYVRGLAHREFLQDLRSGSKDDLEFHKQKADRSMCPRRQDFNRLYADFCTERYGARNGLAMFSA